jgi:hypothetical protein
MALWVVDSKLIDSKLCCTVSGFVMRHELNNPDLDNDNMAVGDENMFGSTHFLTFCSPPPSNMMLFKKHIHDAFTC